MKDRTAIGGRADITDIGAAQLLGAQAGEQTGQDQRQVPFGSVGPPLGLVVGLNRLEQSGDRGLGQGAGRVLAALGRPTNGIGLAPMSSLV